MTAAPGDREPIDDCRRVLVPVIGVAEAMAAHARVLERPELIEWRPSVADRGDEIAGFHALLASAKNLRARIHARTAGDTS